MSRKTIPVESVRLTANIALAHVVDGPDLDGRARRLGIIGMVESVLFATDNYRGYRILPSEYAALGQPTAGPESVLRAGYDDTRRAYLA